MRPSKHNEPMMTNNAVWDKAYTEYHNVRHMDRGLQLFKCFTCQSWFDHGMQLDRNFKMVNAQEIEQCPIAQVDLFEGPTSIVSP